jgi:hypothetical protein
MWAKGHRARQAAFERQRRYPTDLTDPGWKRISRPEIGPGAGAAPVDQSQVEEQHRPR